MKKALSVIMAGIMVASLFVAMPAPAAATYTIPDLATIEKVIRATGIMTGDENGEMNLQNSVTRAEFAKLLVAASPYKDNVSVGSGFSPFKDVTSAHWASGFIKTAVAAGWLTGYLDGTYRPQNIVLLEEAASAILRLLGYGPSDIVGTYPTAQISRFTSLDLATGLSVSQGSPLSRKDCMIIFFNLLSAEHRDGTVYGAKLGYPIDDDGFFDYEAYLDDKIEGPFVLASGSLASNLPFPVESAQIFRNGRAATAFSAAEFDVYYYNEVTREVWIFTDRVIGLFTNVSPNRVSPEVVTVGGNDYILGTAEARRKVSSLGSFAAGDTIALLLGMDGDVVDIVEARLVDATHYGMVTSVELVTYTTGDGQSVAEFVATVACTDGVIRQCVVPGDDLSEGALVSVAYTNGNPRVRRLPSRALRGTVNAAADRLGGHAFAEDIEIMEVSGSGEWTILYPNRLSRADLTGGVRFHLLNSRGEIEVLILEGVTGDVYSYGVITSVEERRIEIPGETPGMTRSRNIGVYSYIIEGGPGVMTTSRFLRLNAGTAGRFIRGDDGGIGANIGFGIGIDLGAGNASSFSSIKSLNSVPLTDISTSQMTAVGANKRYDISDSVQVYIRSGNDYHLTDLSAVTDTSAFTLNGFYEEEFPAGGQIRIIIARRRHQ